MRMITILSFYENIGGAARVMLTQSERVIVVMSVTKMIYI